MRVWFPAEKNSALGTIVTGSVPAWRIEASGKWNRQVQHLINTHRLKHSEHLCQNGAKRKSEGVFPCCHISSSEGYTVNSEA